LWKSLQDVTSKVAPSVSSSLKEIGSSTKEVWLDPLREITRDIAGDVREAFRPGGASEAHASLRATAADARGATPRNVAASASSRDAAGASALSFRGGIGWEPSPSSEPPSAGERLESIFAALETGEGDTDLEAAERGTRTRRLGVPNEIEEEPVLSGDGDAATRAVRTPPRFCATRPRTRFPGWGRCEKKTGHGATISSRESLSAR
jgi:hypothetical protein